MTELRADELKLLNEQSEALIVYLDDYISYWFGERCKETAIGCPICDMWAKRDDLKAYICD